MPGLRRATVLSAKPQFSSSMLQPLSKGKDFKSSASESEGQRSSSKAISLKSDENVDLDFFLHF